MGMRNPRMDGWKPLGISSSDSSFDISGWASPLFKAPVDFTRSIAFFIRLPYHGNFSQLNSNVNIKAIHA